MNISLQKAELRELLAHLHVEELKQHLEQLNLPSKGHNKHELVERLLVFITTGKVLPPQEIPQESRARAGVRYPLAPDTRMLFGAYKNDYATRLFFKSLIGPHFHFTAQGIDWLRERWLAGTPPTYSDFAREWQESYLQNKIIKPAAKQEWAYIRFLQTYQERFPSASKHEARTAWNAHRFDCVQKINQILSAMQISRDK